MGFYEEDLMDQDSACEKLIKIQEKLKGLDALHEKVDELAKLVRELSARGAP